MALDGVKHVEAVAILKRLVESPDLEGRDAALQWLEENHPAPADYTAAARSLGVEEDDREFREGKVLDTVREWLPEVANPGYVIQVKAAAADAPDGAMFEVTRTRVFACARKPPK